MLLTWPILFIDGDDYLSYFSKVEWYGIYDLKYSVQVSLKTPYTRLDLFSW